MTSPDKKLTALLYSFEGAGAVFVVVFLAAYLWRVAYHNGSAQ